MAAYGQQHNITVAMQDVILHCYSVTAPTCGKKAAQEIRFPSYYLFKVCST